MKPVVEPSPFKSLAEELDFLRKLLRETVLAYSRHCDTVLAQTRHAVMAETKNAKVKADRLRDARDMITLIRKLKVRPEKGRRRDLKKLDLLLEELQRFTDNW